VHVDYPSELGCYVKRAARPLLLARRRFLTPLAASLAGRALLRLLLRDRAPDLAGRRVRIPETGREAVVLRGAGDAGRPVAQEQAEESAGAPQAA
jgi:hypothetical protein